MRQSLVVAALIAVLAGPALAQIGPARAAGIVGEQDDGYLGFAKTPPADVRAAVDAINIKRRQAYTELAAQRGVTVQEVAAAKGCDQIANHVDQGEAYRVGGAWQVRSGAVTLPKVCG